MFSTISAQSSATISEVFFLDLGIVIEPSTGDEKYNRIVEAPSEEVSFQIKKAKSGSIYMAASKEMLASLERINNRIATLENSFQEKLFDLQQENQLLKNMIADINNPPKMADETQNSINATVDEPTNLLEVQLIYLSNQFYQYFDRKNSFLQNLEVQLNCISPRVSFEIYIL